ncbi:hypothetical protein FEM48_Zijuj01G0137000 [Ziziphus jujuba var. spinosa]|uniref:FYVE-type domain-containing protein n=1 Tax=Ziziphus jujuba var. spinosa TaxID=714518 RepID=A0A978W1L2_ZIZJJ|nr:hypothetical protein FEM48_Zijuj01G0137000 [Ziziphus jujuba var. spinosa]
MLEKIGLPAKPAIRGNNWVVDASHCQGCSSQFTFINRKHHCRRCGGLFCNGCTQGRMVLRGQGDSPVRVCEPCKKLEEAARFEMRYGHRSRAGRGSSKSTSKNEIEVLNQILANDRKEVFSSGLESNNDMPSSIHRGTSNASSSNSGGDITLDGEGEIQKSPIDKSNHVSDEMGMSSPDELRQQALDEKKKYKILKGEGKPDEALRAFKRGKELERQAEALEKNLRKSRKNVSLSTKMEEVQIKNDSTESGRINKVAPPEGKQKDDLAAQLRELGWSETDIHNEDKKVSNMSLEGELSSLIGEISERTNKDKGTSANDKSQVVAHKKRALALKREGKLAEAKEELKRAKILEKQLEEQELLAEAEDSDDELSALIRGMDNDKQEEFSIPYDHEHNFDFDHLLVAAEDQTIDGIFEVTDEDMEDPEIASALKSLGWSEDSDFAGAGVPQIVSVDREAVLSEILSLKREALSQKRAGNVAEAMAQLKKAKLLERDLEGFESKQGTMAKHSGVQKDSSSQAVGHSSKSFLVGEGNIEEMKDVDSRVVPRSRLMIQKELLSLKKKALALRREGRLDEAEEELKRGKVLEHQLEEMENEVKVKTIPVDVGSKISNLAYEHLPNFSGNLPIGIEEGEDVTDQDMYDPTYLSLLKNLGWNEQESDEGTLSSKAPKQRDNPSIQTSESSVTQALLDVQVGESRRSKAEIQKELLGLKRKALALRRKGETKEAEEVLNMAKILEAQIADMEASEKVQSNSMHKETIMESPLKSADEEGNKMDVTENDMHDPSILSMLKNSGWKDGEQETVPSLVQSSSVVSVAPQRSKGEIQRELLNLKRKALALRRKGETEEAEEVLRMAKVLESQMEETVSQRLHLHDALDNEKAESLESLVVQEKQGNVKDSIQMRSEMTQVTVGSSDNVVDLSLGSERMENDVVNPPLANPISIPLNSQLIEGDHLDTPETLENTSIPQPGQPSSLTDLLTGDDWRGSQTSEKHIDRLSHQSDDIFLTCPPFQSQTLTSSNEEQTSKDDVKTESGEKLVLKDEKPYVYHANLYQEHASQNNQSTFKEDILAHKRKAVALKREGKLIEAREELRHAKLLEKHLEKDSPESKTSSSDVSVSTSNVASVSQKVSSSSNTTTRPLSSRDRFKLQQESLAHKRQALKLRREGRTEEAEAEIELAKALETQLEELSAHDSTKSAVDGVEPDDDVGVEDFLDPHLLSALKAIGIEGTNGVSRGPQRPQPSNLNSDKSNSLNSVNQDRIQLEEQIKAEKVKAVNLKRSGKQAEALDSLRRAKLLEKKLSALHLQ